MLTIYTSLPASPGLATLVLCLPSEYGQQVQVRPLSELPSPDPAHTQRLRAEQADLQQTLQRVEWSLEQYRSGQWQPDAGEQNGLAYQRDALQTRLMAIGRALGGGKAGGTAPC
jgi:hypothetical protein